MQRRMVDTARSGNARRWKTWPLMAWRSAAVPPDPRHGRPPRHAVPAAVSCRNRQRRDLATGGDSE